MATRPLPGFSGWFHDFQSSRDPRYPAVLWPALMAEARTPSLVQRHYRFTLAFWRWRWSWLLIHQAPEPDTPFNDPSLSVNELIRWSSNWSKGRVTARDIQELLTQKGLPWGRLVRFGAANYHYGRLVISREAMALSRTRANAPAASSGALPELDLPSLNLPGEKGPSQGEDA